MSLRLKKAEVFVPDRKKGEPAEEFVSRCMSSEIMKKEYPDTDQRLAVCISKSKEKASSDISSRFQDELTYQMLRENS